MHEAQRSEWEQRYCLGGKAYPQHATDPAVRQARTAAGIVRAQSSSSCFRRVQAEGSDSVLTDLPACSSASLVYGLIFASVTMATYFLARGQLGSNGCRFSVWRSEWGALPTILGFRYRRPYASHLVEVCTDFGVFILDLTVANCWEDTSVDQGKSVPFECVFCLEVPEKPPLSLCLEG